MAFNTMEKLKYLQKEMTVGFAHTVEHSMLYIIG